MKFKFAAFAFLFTTLASALAQPDQPLRVFILARDGAQREREHAPARFLQAWKKLLQERGAVTAGASTFPSRAQLEKTDVLVLYGQGKTLTATARENLEAFLNRGGGIVMLHDALGGGDAPFWKTVLGGGWVEGKSQTRAGLVGLYFRDYPHPITEGVANFDLDDEMFYRLQMVPEAKIIGTTFQTAKEVVPQMWVYERDNYRAFVSLTGHRYASFNQPHFRGLLLRGIAWAGKRHVDLLTNTDELSHFKYPEGGPTPPELAGKKIKVQPEFDLSLVAAEPLVAKPISVDWDARGRMWVALTPEYPFKVDAAPARDSIVILEDTDGDGRMDRRQIFYEGLNLVTSFVFYRDGIIVSQAPDILWLRDTDGDGVADKKEVLFSGFGRRDTHAVISNLRWSMDGWIYGDQGYSGDSSENIVSRDGKSFGKIGPGIFRFQPDASAIEMVSSFSGNTWGLDFAWDGELFFSKANGPHISHVMMSEKFLARGKIPKTTSDKSIEDHQKVVPIFTDQRHEYVQVAPVGVFTAASGCMIYDGGAWPPKYNGSHFVSEPTVHIVHEDIISAVPEGIGYEATKRYEAEFIAATDLWFRPVQTRFGPDGAMYILDFYNQAISHNDIRGIAHGPGNAAVRPDRDHTHGRIWRVQHKQARRLAVPDFVHATPTEWVQSLEHPNGWVRMTAQRLLVEKRDLETVKPLAALAQKSRLPYARVQALWCLQHLGELSETNLIAAISDVHPAVQKNALQIIGEGTAPLTAALEKVILKQLKETDERVRQRALLALQRAGLSKEANQAVLKLFPDVKDAWSRSAMVGIAQAAPMEFIKGAFASDKADSYKELIGLLVDEITYKRDVDKAAEMIQLAARKPTEAESLKQVVLENLGKNPSAEFVPPWTPELEKAFRALLASQNSGVRFASLALVNQWDKDGSLVEVTVQLREQMLADLSSKKLNDEQRTKLISSLMAIPALQREVIPALDNLLDAGLPSALRRHIIGELGKATERLASEVLIKRFPSFNFETKQAALNSLLKRADWSSALVDAIETRVIQLNDLGVEGVGRLQNHSDKSIAKRASAVVAAIQGPASKEKEELVARFKPLLEKSADLKNGKEMFLKNCAICHKLGGEGKDLGPDLTGVGVHGSGVLLVHILDPNRVVEGNYVAYNVTTKQQEDFYGLVVRENRESVALRNLEGETEIRRADIASMKSSGMSLMPEGLEALGEKNIRDIIGYLTEKAPKGFRVLDLLAAFTVDSRKGVDAQETDPPQIELKKFGIVMVGGVPFNIINSAAVSGGKNLIMLRGRSGLSITLPQQVEFSVNAKVAKLFLLGGITGGESLRGAEKSRRVPVAKARIYYADGKSEEIILRSGDESADMGGQVDLSASKSMTDLVARGQILQFSLKPQSKAQITKIRLESFDNHITPAFLAMTVQLSD